MIDQGSAGSETTRKAVGWPSCRLLLVILLALAVLPYANTLNNSFVHDDTAQVVENPYLRDASHLGQIFTSSVWSFTGNTRSNYYRPMMTLGYLLCYLVFGPLPLAFHLANLLLHASIVCLLFITTNTLLSDRNTAFVAAALFALHPIHTESVAWIAAVTELELAFFYLLTFWLFLGLDRQGKASFPWKSVLMTLSFALALLSKEQAMTLPLVATIYEHVYRGDRLQTTRGQKLSRYAPLWLLALAYLPVRTHSLGGFAPEIKFQGMSQYELLLSAVALTGQYLGKLLWPVDLFAFYVFQKSTTFFDVRVLLGLIGIGISAAIFRVLWNRSRIASFGIVWVFITLAPVLNPQLLGANAFTERYVYLPSVGFCWVAAFALRSGFRLKLCLRPVWRVAFFVGIGIAAVLCSARIVTRNRDWRDNIVFYERMLAVMPRDATTYNLRLDLAVEYIKQGKMTAAEEQLRIILDSEPNQVNALNDLGGVLLHEGRPVSALETYLRVIQLEPHNSNSHVNAGVAYMYLDMLDKAESEFQTALTIAPKNVNAHDNLAVLYGRRGDYAQAERAFWDALAIEPTNSNVRVDLANLYVAALRGADAIREYQTALRFDPANVTAIRELRALYRAK
jgi:Tfp pilus assembly protein PilF